MDMGRGEGEIYGNSNMETHTTVCKIESHGKLLYGSGNSNKGPLSMKSGGMGGRWEGG